MRDTKRMGGLEREKGVKREREKRKKPAFFSPWEEKREEWRYGRRAKPDSTLLIEKTTNGSRSRTEEWGGGRAGGRAGPAPVALQTVARARSGQLRLPRTTI